MVPGVRPGPPTAFLALALAVAPGLCQQSTPAGEVPAAAGTPSPAASPRAGRTTTLGQELATIRSELREIKAILRLVAQQLGVPLPADARAARGPIRPVAVAARGPTPRRPAGPSPRPVLDRLGEVEARLGQLGEVQATVGDIQAGISEARQDRERARLVQRARQIQDLISQHAHSSSPEIGNTQVTLYFFLPENPDHYSPVLEAAEELQATIDAIDAVADRLSTAQRQAFEAVRAWGRASRIVKGLTTLGTITPVLR